MRFFKAKNSDDSRARRTSRLRLLKARETALLAFTVAFVGICGFAGYHNNLVKKAEDWATSKTLDITANAGFKVKDILVTGRQQIPADELLAHLSIKQNMPIFGVNIAEAEKSLVGISWVKDVAITRRLPDQIVVDLKERTPVALWQYKKKIALIDQEGAVLATQDLNTWQQLPLVVGEDAPKHITEILGFLTAEPALAGSLEAAVRIGGRRWDLHLKNGPDVKLPEQDAELALRRLMDLQEKKNIFGRDIAAIDLRLPDKIVVTNNNAT